MAHGIETVPKRFAAGDLVEVKQKEKGLRGAWFAAAIVGVLPGRRIVEYDELLAHEGCTTKLRETISISAFLDGHNTSWKSAARTAKSRIRPRPSPLSHPTPFSWTKGTWVDCWYKDAWWEGILDEHVTTVEHTESHLILTQKTEVAVGFHGEYDIQKLEVKNMRLTQDYCQDGTWSQREKFATHFKGSFKKEKGKIVEAQLSLDNSY